MHGRSLAAKPEGVIVGLDVPTITDARTRPDIASSVFSSSNVFPLPGDEIRLTAVMRRAASHARLSCATASFRSKILRSTRIVRGAS
ncbi:MAG: hypothetical protein M5R36_00420 [Deltaproteobacteria bacterium]|nr:hypothetical protein [Deltaproteobacteria bacterium]